MEIEASWNISLITIAQIAINLKQYCSYELNFLEFITM